MIDVRALTQLTLDQALGADDVRVYWLRKAETAGEDPNEYAVYTLDGDPAGVYADDLPLTRGANVAIRYYYRDTMLDTAAGRRTVTERERQIYDALTAAGFTLSNGYFDAGDIDDVGFCTTVFDCSFWRVV